MHTPGKSIKVSRHLPRDLNIWALEEQRRLRDGFKIDDRLADIRYSLLSRYLVGRETRHPESRHVLLDFYLRKPEHAN